MNVGLSGSYVKCKKEDKENRKTHTRRYGGGLEKNSRHDVGKNEVIKTNRNSILSI